ncbi:hypothetical protein PAMC26510_08280 [Caballeronia sordidicola]|uniref:Uncharacterized protein n=1 Tax=Caballeronia sordidicola TaxID=196367 RepID=A0A242N1W0_CABSO|nr:hypothetical protein PAMC26510_08280 [Caballeronia sordidicola]
MTRLGADSTSGAARQLSAQLAQYCFWADAATTQWARHRH